jgi:hypothetical protein
MIDTFGDVCLLIFFKIDRIHGARRYAARACSACLCHKRFIFCLSTIFLWLYWHQRQYIDQNFEKNVFSYVFGQKLTFQVNFWPTKSENFDWQYPTFLCIFAPHNFNQRIKNISKIIFLGDVVKKRIFSLFFMTIGRLWDFLSSLRKHFSKKVNRAIST